MKSCAGLDEDHYKHPVLQTYAGMLGDPNYINAIVRKKVKPLGGTWVIHENGTVSSMDNPKTRCAEHESEVSCTDPTHLKNLGVGTQILLPHGDLQVGELMDQRGTASSSAEVPRCWPSGKKPPRTEGKDETMEESSTYG